MLNIAPIFQRAIDAYEEFGDYLDVPPLPSAVYMFQRDVVNHYRQAATHYFAISLDEPFLQNSSIGSPYEKWAKFTNEDFFLFNFACHTLIRYTSRLVHSTTYVGLMASQRARETKSRCDMLTTPICQLRQSDLRIGVKINDSKSMTVFRFGEEIEQETISIADRAVLEAFRDKFLHEADELEELNTEFGALCQKTGLTQSPCQPYDTIHSSFWI